MKGNLLRSLDAKVLVSNGLVILAVASLAVSLRALPDLRLPALLEFLRAEWFVIFTVVAGVVLLLLAVLVRAVAGATDTVVTLRFFSGRKYFQTAAGVNDLKDLYGHYTNLFGQDLVPMDQMASWIQKNGDIAWKVMRIADSDEGSLGASELVGFFDIEPLTQVGEMKLRAPAARAVGIKKGDIHSGKVGLPPTSYYVGSVGCPKGSAPLCEGVCMVYFIRKMLDLAHKRTITVYARPATDKGVYLVRDLFHMNKRHNGPDKEVVWSLEVNSDTLVIPASYMKLARRLKISLR